MLSKWTHTIRRLYIERIRITHLWIHLVWLQIVLRLSKHHTLNASTCKQSHQTNLVNNSVTHNLCAINKINIFVHQSNRRFVPSSTIAPLSTRENVLWVRLHHCGGSKVQLNSFHRIFQIKKVFSLDYFIRPLFLQTKKKMKKIKTKKKNWRIVI